MFIRTFNVADYEEIFELWKAVGLSLRPSDEFSEISKKLERDPELFLVAEEQGHIVGTVMGSWDGRRGAVYHLAVLPSFQKRGCGSQLMQEIEKRLRQKGALKLNLLVEERNKGVVEFYRKLGYEVNPYVSVGKELI